jgi:superfamily II DNA/RNA helicase
MQNDQIVNFSNVRMLIIDEADEMLTEFTDSLANIFNHPANCVPECQFIVVSATWPEEVIEFCDSKKLLRENKSKRIRVKKEELTLDGILQSYIKVNNKTQKIECIEDLYETMNVQQAIIFANSTSMVIELTRKMSDAGYPSTAFHAMLEQHERTQIMKSFKKGEFRILISTDVIGRGLDIQGVKYVINFELPVKKESYLHRIGRSGRYGRKGVAINMIENNYDLKKIQDLENYYQTTINELSSDFESHIDDL